MKCKLDDEVSCGSLLKHLLTDRIMFHFQFNFNVKQGSLSSSRRMNNGMWSDREEGLGRSLISSGFSMP